MDIKKLRENKLIVHKVEEALQAAYSSNQEFNAVLDDAAFEIPDHFALLNEPATVQERARKEARLLQLKIRPLRYATPADAEGKADHSLLEQILKLAVAVAHRQVVFE